MVGPISSGVRKRALRSEVKVVRMASKKFEGWRIKFVDHSCGCIKFHPKIDSIFHEHVTVEIKIPQTHQGRHIGRFALGKALKASRHLLFIAHLRKTNIASQKVLQAVGFKKIEAPGASLCMSFRKES